MEAYGYLYCSGGFIRGWKLTENGCTERDNYRMVFMCCRPSSVAFSPSYNSHSSGQCESDKISPGEAYSDRVSSLTVGQTYQYCVSASKQNYMVKTDTADGTFNQRSAPSCVQHTVMWVSIILISCLKRCYSISHIIL